MKIVAFKKTSNSWWAVLESGKEFIVSYVFVTKQWGILAELERATEGNFCVEVASGVEIPSELM